MHARGATPHRIATLLVLAVLGPLAVLTGCGGADEDDVEQVLQRSLTTRDAKVACEGTLSSGLIKRIYGSADRCRKVEGADAKDSARAKRVEVSKTAIDGDHATATVELEGGQQSGAKGEIRLVDQDGDWRIDDLSAGYLRSQFRAALRVDRTFDAKTRACLGKQTLALDDEDFRDLAYGAMGERADAQQRLVKLISGCQENGKSLLRTQFEQGIERSLQARDATGEQIDCVTGRLRSNLTDDQIDAVARAGKVTGAVRDAVAGALKACGTTTG